MSDNYCISNRVFFYRYFNHDPNLLFIEVDKNILPAK